MSCKRIRKITKYRSNRLSAKLLHTASSLMPFRMRTRVKPTVTLSCPRSPSAQVSRKPINMGWQHLKVKALNWISKRCILQLATPECRRRLFRTRLKLQRKMWTPRELPCWARPPMASLVPHTPTQSWVERDLPRTIPRARNSILKKMKKVTEKVFCQMLVV